MQLKSKDFDILNDYLKKTISNLVIPRIILDETAGLYGRTLTERVDYLNKSLVSVNSALTGKHLTLQPPVIDISTKVEQYKHFIIERFKVREGHILPYKNEFLPEIAARAINRRKPCGDKGQGFRDALIWLTIKDYAKQADEHQIVFISNNIEDFANTEKSGLHQSLLDECNEIGITINYFKTVREFIEKLSTKIDFITYDWLAENLDETLISEISIDLMNIRRSSSITSWFERKTGEHCTDYNVLCCYLNNTRDLYVYEMSDNSLFVNVVVEAEIEVEFGFYSSVTGFKRIYLEIIRTIMTCFTSLKLNNLTLN